MADLLVKDTSLTAVANAIRAKTGGSSPINFPDGFVSEIGSLTDTSDATATEDKILSGFSAYGAAGTKLNGNIVSQAAQTITPTSQDQTIQAGKYLSGAQTIEGVVCENLSPENIADGVTVKIGTATDDDSVALVVGTHQGGGGYTKPSYLISDGDTISDLYFNIFIPEQILDYALSQLTYEYDPVSQINVCLIGFSDPQIAGLNNLYAIDLSALGLQNEYALVWNDGTITPIYLTTDVPNWGNKGWQLASLTLSTAVTVDEAFINQTIKPYLDNVITKEQISFGNFGIFWEGTQSEYDNLSSYDDNTLYCIKGAIQ